MTKYLLETWWFYASIDINIEDSIVQSDYEILDSVYHVLIYFEFCIQQALTPMFCISFLEGLF